METCWLWTGSRDKFGYGNTGTQRSLGTHRAHRVAWILTNGAIPDGLYLCHRCDNPSCVRPDHLFLGTNLENDADKIAKGRHSRGETHGMSRFTVVEVLEMRRLHASGKSQRYIGKQFGTARQVVGRIVRREAWKHV